MVSQIGERLREAREAAGLTQAEAAALLGVVAMTISKREREDRGVSAEEFERMLAVYAAAEVKKLSHFVPRGTPALREASPIPYSLGAKFEALTREIIRAGATDAEVDFLADVLRRPETARMIGTGADGQLLTDAAADEQWETLLDDLRAFIGRRIARRAAPPAQPIKPKDVPGLVAKRHEEVFGSAKKRRTK